MPNISFANLEQLGSASNFIDDILELFKSPSLLEHFSREECSLLCSYMVCYGAPSHATILQEGDGGNFMLIILTGSVNVIKHWQGNEYKIVTLVGPGEFLGEMSLVDGQQRSATCKTAEPTDFAVFSHEALNEILIDHPRLGNKLLLLLLQLITVRLREATVRMLPTIISTLV
ncbi:MAG: cyclic nucleotide-binding domain-containing protein [Propionivibrio sp.]|nr:cyclic nucleotide-binding domain-containing protein [Propionivibrio sp.]